MRGGAIVALDSSFLDQLAAVTGARHVATDEESRERASFDAFGPRRFPHTSPLAEARVDAVARPASTAEVSAIARLANEHRVPLIPYGGGTGVMGGVVPLRGGVSVDMRRMSAVLDVRRADRLARAQSGAYLADLEAAALANGLMLGHDPWSVPVATVGGAISTDGVGYRASKYGSMGDQVRALEVVLADGTVARTRPLPRQSAGPRLNGLFVGAEGSMGIITEATVELFPQPETRAFLTFGFGGFEAGHPAARRLFDIGLTPSLIELTEEAEPMARGFL
ncbi:MAG: FAD-binding oxidoreductase [SAR202 cluster bacterium]|nr:FAD-binding oxidoreductase [SAR202 cluster bacterium]